MARRRPLLLLLCISACLHPYSTPKPFEVETGGQPQDDTTGSSTTAAPMETTEAPDTSTGGGGSEGTTEAVGTTGTSTTADGTTTDASTGTSTTGADTTGGDTTGVDTTTGGPQDMCLSVFDPGDECGECLCDKCFPEQMACIADEGCMAIRACAVLWGCGGLGCMGPCNPEFDKYGGYFGESGLKAIDLGQCAVKKCGLYCDT